jgi:hypothetical protein
MIISACLGFVILGLIVFMIVFYERRPDIVKDATFVLKDIKGVDHSKIPCIIKNVQKTLSYNQQIGAMGAMCMVAYGDSDGGVKEMPKECEPYIGTQTDILTIGANLINVCGVPK